MGAGVGVGEGVPSTESSPPPTCPPGGSLQETTTSLKAEVENHKRELQAGEKPRPPRGEGWGWGWGERASVLTPCPAARSLNDKVFALESKLEKDQRQLQAGGGPVPVTGAWRARGTGRRGP